jgi:hypothetical protein
VGCAGADVGKIWRESKVLVLIRIEDGCMG